MLDDKRLEIIRKNVPLMVNGGEIEKSEKNKQMANFYLENALVSLNVAKILSDASLNDPIKRQFKFIGKDFEAFLWVINTSYYSMFYMAGALLASLGIKVKSEIGIHKKTFEALVFYFYLSPRIAKHYIEEFEVAQHESHSLLGTEDNLVVMQRKAKELIASYDYELDKRGRFTYNMGEKAKSVKAMTSLNRAMEFYGECLKVIGPIL